LGFIARIIPHWHAALKFINAPGAFKGEIQNRENIGKTTAELVALWNADHPNDPVV
jgi:hypothetical protein